MSTFAFDYIAIKEPNLLTTRKKPIGNVEINWLNPITNDLTGCFLFNQKNPFKNHVDDMPNMINATDANFEFIRGNFRLLDTSDYDFRVGNEVIGGSTTYSTTYSLFMIMDVRKAPIGNNDQYVISANPSSPIQTVPIFFDNVGTNGRLTAYGDAKQSIATQEPNYTENIYESYASVTNTTDDHTIYLNGGVAAGGHESFDSNQIFGSPLANDSLHFFADLGDATRRILADVECLYIFNRSLRAIEIAYLHNNPYEFLIPI